MEYSVYQIVLLINDDLEDTKMKLLIAKIKNFILLYTNKIKIKINKNKNLAYKVEEYEKAHFVIIQLALKTIGANKRIKEITQLLNTYEEIIRFDIIKRVKKTEKEIDENQIYVVYEFDYGDVEKQYNPNVTLFECYKNRESATEKALELLKEGLENYCIKPYLVHQDNPFEDRDTVELYDKNNNEEKSVYYISIKRINLI